MLSFFSYYCEFTPITYFTAPTIMNTQTNTAQPKVIVLRAQLPEQMAIVANCVKDGYPVTVYADELTEDVKFFSQLSFVQTRIAQQYKPLPEDGTAKVYS